MIRPNLKKLEQQCRDFNARVKPFETHVIYHPVIGQRAGQATRTRTLAYILGGHTAVVFVENVPGCVALDAIEIPENDRHQCITHTSLEELWTAIFDLTEAYGKQPLSEWSGCWNVVLPGGKWALAINGHPEEHESAFSVKKIPPFHVFIQFDRWPFGLINPQSGCLGCGTLANIDTLHEAIVQATERRRVES